MAASVKGWMEGIRVLEYLPYLLDLAPANFFLFKAMKKSLAGIMLD
jgi:hypothetical protein